MYSSPRGGSSVYEQHGEPTKQQRKDDAMRDKRTRDLISPTPSARHSRLTVLLVVDESEVCEAHDPLALLDDDVPGLVGEHLGVLLLAVPPPRRAVQLLHVRPEQLEQGLLCVTSKKKTSKVRTGEQRIMSLSS